MPNMIIFAYNTLTGSSENVINENENSSDAYHIQDNRTRLRVTSASSSLTTQVLTYIVQTVLIMQLCACNLL